MVNQQVQFVSLPQGEFKFREVNSVNGCSGCVGHISAALCEALPNCCRPVNGIYVERVTERTVTEASPAALYRPAHGGYPPVQLGRVEDAFDPGLARKADPVTSHEAAEEVGGGKLVDLILRHLAEDGNTGKELAVALGRPLNSITPRFAPMRRAGYIHPAGKRDKQIVWKRGNGVAA